MAYAVIRETAWSISGEYRRGVDQLAQDCNVSRQSVSAWLGELEALGAITIVRKPRARGNDLIRVSHPAVYDFDALHAYKAEMAARARAKRAGRPSTRASADVKAEAASVRSAVGRQVNSSLPLTSTQLDGSIEEDSLKKSKKTQEASPVGRSSSRGRGWWFSGDDLVIADELDDTPEVRALLRTLDRAIVRGVDLRERLRPIVGAFDDPASGLDAVLLELAE